ncbi:spermatogenesis-associated protein 19, mitochondrial-like isoform X1 [Tamandua tetradactyla]|uniref:spermatogenesis-associated protein 19, mitochondrial-like isoform X1 n=1 Tax=Tamandua tetradactyla TaxID=48850 RepID=UPI00405483BD
MDYVHSRPERFRVTLPTKYRSDIEVVESEVVSVVQHWLKKTEEEASQDIKEKMSNSKCPSTHGQNIHGTRDMVKHQLSKSDVLANRSQEVLEERMKIQFIRWSTSCSLPSAAYPTSWSIHPRIHTSDLPTMTAKSNRLTSFRVKEQPVSEQCPPPHLDLMSDQNRETWAERVYR